MAKYTTEVRHICENYANLTESKGYNSIQSILNESWDKVFDFDFPIFDENYREPLCKKILKHFYTKEIGEETVGLWKLRLDDRMNEIMPYYNKLYESELISIEPLVNYRVRTNGNNTKTGSDGVAETGQSSETDTLHGTSVRTGGYTDTHDGTDTLEKQGKETYDKIGKEVDTKTGNETNAKTGTETDTKTGNETNTKTGKESDVKTGSIDKQKLGIITEEQTAEGNRVQEYDGQGGTLDTENVDLFTDTPQGNILNMGDNYGTSGTTSDVPIVGDDTSYLTTAEKTKETQTDNRNWKKKDGWDEDYKETRKTIYGDDSGETPVPMSEKEEYNDLTNEKTFDNRTDTKTYNNVTDTKTFANRTDTKSYNNVKNEKEFTNRKDETSFTNRKDVQTKDLEDKRVYNSQTDTNDNSKQVYGNSSKNKTMTYGNTNTYLDFVIGSKGKSDSVLLQEFRKTFLNIDEMILNRLNDLFMLIW